MPLTTSMDKYIKAFLHSSHFSLSLSVYGKHQPKRLRSFYQLRHLFKGISVLLYVVIGMPPTPKSQEMF